MAPRHPPLRTRSRCVVAIAAALAVAPASFAQSGRERSDIDAPPDPSTVGSDVGSRRWYVRRQWTVHDGLPQSTVSAIASSGDGLLWLTTEAGPVRFDGREFATAAVDPAWPTSVQLFHGVVAAGPGRMRAWSVRGEVVEFDAADGARAVTLGGLDGDVLQALVPDGDGWLWLGRHRLERRGPRGTRVLLDRPDAVLTTVLGMGDGRVLVGGAALLLTIDADGAIAELPGEWSWIRGLAADRRGGAWVASDAGTLHVTDPFTAPQRRAFDARPATAVLFDRAGALWVGTDHGALRWPGGDREVAPTRSPMLGDVQCLVECAIDDAVWVGTGTRGLFCVVPTTVELHGRGRGLDARLYTAIAELTDHSVLVGAEDGRTWRRAAGENVYAAIPPAEAAGQVLSIQPLAAGGARVGAAGGAFVLRDGRLVPIAALAGYRWVRAFADFDGATWVGTSDGLLRWDGAERVESVPLALKRADVWCLTVRDDRLLVGLRDGGVRVVRPTGGGAVVVETLAGTDASGRDLPVCSLLDRGDEIWIGCHGGALWRHAGGVLERAPIPRDVLPIAILGLATDDTDEHLFATATRGVLRFGLPSLRDAIARGDDDFRFDLVPCDDLVHVAELNGMSGSALAVAHDGRLLACALGGLLTIRSEEFARAVAAPEVRIGDVRVDDQPVATIDGVHAVPPGARRVTVRIRSRSVLHGERTRFESRVLGVDRGWVPVAADGELTLPRLASGRHVLEVRARMVGARPGPAVAVRLDLLAPWHQTPAGLVALSSGFAVLAFAVWRWRSAASRHSRVALEREVAARTAELRTEVARKEAAEAELRRSQAELDDRVRLRTAELDTANARLVTELEQRETLQSELVRAQKLDGLARLAGGVAHDLNNLLTAILGFADSARQQATDQPELVRDLGEIDRATGRAAALVGQLLAFARQQPITAERIDAGELVRGLAPMLERLVGPERRLVLDLDAGPCPLWVDPVQIEQVLTNLVVNARDATRDGGTITVATRAAAEGGLVTLAVRDDGIGIAPDLIDRIFDPFFTTKSSGHGLGLSICHGVVTKAGGRIRVESTRGAGTVFGVELPSARASTAAATVAPERGLHRGTVLAIDDQVAVLRVIERSLRRGGYEVVACATADAVIAEVTRGAPRFDAIVCDVVMPELEGPALTRRLAGLGIDAPVLFVTGFAPDHGLEQALAAGAALLRKPFTSAQLLAAVAAVIAGRPAVDRG